MLLPFLTGFELGFYSRYEDLIIKELDPEENAMKKGNFPSVFRLVEFTFLLMFTFMA